MKIKIRPDEADAHGTSEWAAMNDWLAELRDDGQAEPDSEADTGPAGGDYAGTAGGEYAGTAGSGDSRTASESYAARDNSGDTETGHGGHTGMASGGDVQPPAGTSGVTPPVAAPLNGYAFRTRAAARAPVSAPAEAPFVRAVIGDELRTPTAWCEMSSCISWHADRSALGEADVRARAIGAGWRIDALGRLVCPQCQQTSTSFRATRPVVPWDRATAITMAARATVQGNRTTGSAGRPTGSAARTGSSARSTGSAARASGHGTRRAAHGQR
jgi:hypothetical protein